VVQDDFTHALGDQNESLLFSALSYRATGSCGTPPAGVGDNVAAKLVARGAQPGYLIRSRMKEIRILRPQT
jgi:hypothetical protein